MTRLTMINNADLGIETPKAFQLNSHISIEDTTLTRLLKEEQEAATYIFLRVKLQTALTESEMDSLHELI